MSAPVLRCQEVSVHMEGASGTILADVTLEAGAGERIALLGPNGAGKTTLLRAIVGLLPFDGQIEVAGIPVSPQHIAAVRERVGFLFTLPEDQVLFPRVIDDVAFGLRRRGTSVAEASERAREALRALEIAELAERAPYELSHGQVQRVALAGALVTRPALLLLDEPSAGLDPSGRRLLAGLLAEQPAAMLIATHDLAFARRTCSRFVRLEEGIEGLVYSSELSADPVDKTSSAVKR